MDSTMAPLATMVTHTVIITITSLTRSILLHTVVLAITALVTITITIVELTSILAQFTSTWGAQTMDIDIIMDTDITMATVDTAHCTT